MNRVSIRPRAIHTWVLAAVWITLLSCRLPPRLSRWRIVSPDDAAIGAVPANDAYAAALRNRVGSAGDRQDRRGAGAADPDDVGQGGAVLVEHPGDVGVQRRDRAVDGAQLGEQSTHDQPAADADRVGGVDAAQQRGGLVR